MEGTDCEELHGFDSPTSTRGIFYGVPDSTASRRASVYELPSPRPETLAASDARLSRWVHDPLDKTAAVSALLAGDDGVGSFCIRKGTQGPVLVVRLSQNKIAHFRIVQTADAVRIKDLAPLKARTFSNLSEAISFLRKTPIGDVADKLSTCIPHPTMSDATQAIVQLHTPHTDQGTGTDSAC